MKSTDALEKDPRTQLGKAVKEEVRRLGRDLTPEEHTKFVVKFLKENYPEYWAFLPQNRH